jgi:hypothetical protein
MGENFDDAPSFNFKLWTLMAKKLPPSGVAIDPPEGSAAENLGGGRIKT